MNRYIERWVVSQRLRAVPRPDGARHSFYKPRVRVPGRNLGGRELVLGRDFFVFN